MVCSWVASVVNNVSNIRFCCGVSFVTHSESTTSVQSVTLQCGLILKFSEASSCRRYLTRILYPVTCCRCSHIVQMISLFFLKEGLDLHSGAVVNHDVPIWVCYLQAALLWRICNCNAVQLPFVWPLRPPGRLICVNILLFCLGN